MYRFNLSNPLSVLLLALAAFTCAPAHALQTYCVGTVAELRNALVQSELDADDSRIDRHEYLQSLAGESSQATHPLSRNVVPLDAGLREFY